MKRPEEIRQALERLASAMVTAKDQLAVTLEQHGPEVVYVVTVAQADMRRLIGTNGANFDAISTLVWSMGNLTSPPLKTRLARIQQVQPSGEVDPAALFRRLAAELRLPPLDALTISHTAALLARAGEHAFEIRAYLLGMCGSNLSPEARRILSQ
jgi:predicted RNA-binding protein YlqC (UPF0109 family)